MRSRVFEVPEAPGVPDALGRLCGRHAVVALDSAAGSPRDWSIVAFDPLAHLRLLETIADLRRVLEVLESEPGDAIPGPFHGGFIGALAYDLGIAGERADLTSDDPWHSPRIVGGVYVDFLVRDERAGRAWLVLGEGDLDGRRPLIERRAEILSALLSPPPPRARPAPVAALVRHTSAVEHMRRIEDVRERIAAGDLYQANLAHRSTRAVRGHPVDLYLELRARNPAPYMAYLAWDERTAARAERFPRGAILSASPELFFEFDGSTARTRPIKGTAARASDPRVDAEQAAALLASGKDRAELAMIVDLERNDLGRVARIGSVRAEAFPRLETYASVHHLTADVTAELAPGRDAIDVLLALFPGGSITGAPKIAAMAEIARLEGEGRGFFTGALGFIDVRGHAAWNILIRTLIWRPDAGGEVSFHVGGGITWSSDAAAEERETQAKAAALVAALEPSAETRGA
ncbi:MAG: anthranilate synthase component I family protein [Planctomycetes bacterium]|nr:anthranilate synthase component I family protein [Planctomycetota bacterium]